MENEVIFIPLDRIRIVNPRLRDRRKFEKIIESIRNLGLKKPIQVSPRQGASSDLRQMIEKLPLQGKHV